MENKEFVIDRIEGEFAVCEMPDETEKTIPLSLLPDGVKEGAVLEFSEGVYTVNEEKTKARRKSNFDLQSALFKRKKK